MPNNNDAYIGTTLKEAYKIEQKISEGGMGFVYRAKQIALGRDVAIKIIQTEDQTTENFRRFLREAKFLSQLNHQNIVTIIDFGHTDLGVPYIVMEYLTGKTLEEACPVNGLSLEMIVEIMLQICEGIESAHRINLLHRDLKPPNIFLSKNSTGSYVVKILDFGLAKPVIEDSLHPKTESGYVMGTAGYLAPEQLVPSSIIDLRADIYALGCLLYFMVTGYAPYYDVSTNLILQKQLLEDPPAIDYQELNKLGAEVLDPVIKKAMARNTKNRYQSVADFKEAFLLAVGKSSNPNNFEAARSTSDLSNKKPTLEANKNFSNTYAYLITTLVLLGVIYLITQYFF